jgi:predicted nucleic acid-binding Zn ribbon protein
MRKFAYAFELKVGKGRLYVSGFNFTGLNSDVPETCRMFETLIRYVTSAAFAPSAEITVSVLEEYLKQKGSAPRLKERKMTQYWQLDEEPLESARYWKESEEYIAGTLKVPSKDKVK